MATVKFKRIPDSTDINNVPFEDGSIIISKDGKLVIDYSNARTTFGGSTDTAMSDSSRNAVENKVIKEYIDNKFKDLNGEIVWTNPNPTSNFGAQTVGLSKPFSDGYDAYEIIFRQSTTNGRLMTTGRIPAIYGTILGFNTTGNHFRATGVTLYDQTMTFEDCNPSNDLCIPMYIVFYKTGLF